VKLKAFRYNFGVYFTETILTCLTKLGLLHCIAALQTITKKNVVKLIMCVCKCDKW